MFYNLSTFQFLYSSSFSNLLDKQLEQELNSFSMLNKQHLEQFYLNLVHLPAKYLYSFPAFVSRLLFGMETAFREFQFLSFSAETFQHFYQTDNQLLPKPKQFSLLVETHKFQRLQYIHCRIVQQASKLFYNLFLLQVVHIIFHRQRIRSLYQLLNIKNAVAIGENATA